MASKTTSGTDSGEVRSTPLPRSPASLSPRSNPAPLGIPSQQSTMSASSSVREDYRPPSSGKTPLSTDVSTSTPVDKKEPVPGSEMPESPVLSISLSRSKTNPPEDEPIERGGYSSSALEKVWRIFTCFFVLSPHIGNATLITYGPLYYLLNKESFAYQAAVFVGVAGTVYSVFSSFYSEIIPTYQLSKEKDGKLWRNLIDLTSTYFITTAFTSAVWKLPDITSTQGFIFFGVSYGISYLFLKNYHPNIHKRPTWSQQKFD